MRSANARPLVRKGRICVVFNRSPQPVDELVYEGAIGTVAFPDVSRGWKDGERSG